MPRFMRLQKSWSENELRRQEGVFKLRSVLVKLGGTRLYQQVLKEVKMLDARGLDCGSAMGIYQDEKGSFFADLQRLLNWLNRFEESQNEGSLQLLPKHVTRQKLIKDPPTGMFELSKVLRVLTYRGHPLVYANFRRRILNSDDPKAEYGAYWTEKWGYVAELPRFIEKFLEIEPGHSSLNRVDASGVGERTRFGELASIK